MLNTIVIQGRLSHTPEMRQTQSGTAVLNMSVAVQRNRKDSDGNYPTDFFDCTFWGNSAETAAKFFSKGDPIIVKGRMESRKYEDKSGNKRTAWEIQAENYEFCGPKKEATQNDAPEAPAEFGADTMLCEMDNALF